MTRAALCAALLCACVGTPADSAPTAPTGSATAPQPTKANPMHDDHANDWLLDADSVRTLYRRYHNAGDDVIAEAQKALANDSRVAVRRAAIVVLTAAAAEKASPTYIAALDDAAPLVAAEAAYALSLYAPASLSGPEDATGMAALRAHVAAMRGWLATPDSAIRYNTVRALIAIHDTGTPLAPLFADQTSLVRSVGLELAAQRTLGADDVAAIDAVARRDADRELRLRAVNVVGVHAPRELAEPVLAAALDRGDADRNTADMIRTGKWTSLVPNIVGFLRTHTRGVGAFFTALAELNAVCGASLMAEATTGLDGAQALEALGKLSGHPEWGEAKLREWGKQQPADVAPCRR